MSLIYYFNLFNIGHFVSYRLRFQLLFLYFQYWFYICFATFFRLWMEFLLKPKNMKYIKNSKVNVVILTKVVMVAPKITIENRQLVIIINLYGLKGNNLQALL